METATVVVMFTDLVGSTQLLSSVGPERAEELRREHLDQVRAAVTEAGGREVKNLGDGLMVAFDTPTAAVDAAAWVQQRADLRNRRSDEALLVRIGLSLGEANVEGDDYFGTPVIEAARLCDRAAGSQVLVTDVVQTLVRGRGGHQFVAHGELALKGLDDPVAASELRWQPLSDADLVGVPLPPHLQRPAGSVFVGRSGERAALLAALKEADATVRARIVLVGGEPGIGKTTLLREVGAVAHAQGSIVTGGRCAQDLSVPYQPWREVFAHLATNRPDLLADHRTELRILLGNLPELAEGTHPDPESERWALYRAVLDTLSQVSAEEPLVVMLEDLHWADAASVMLLRLVAESTLDARLLVVGTFREADLDADHALAEALAALHREDGVDRIRLSGFDDLELLALLESLAGHEMDAAGLDLRDALGAETVGNPFFATEILRHLAESGAITRNDGGRWIATTELRAHGLPVSLREVLGRRIRRLGQSTHDALVHAAVIGRDFELGLLAEIIERDEDSTLELIAPAVDAGLVLDVAPGRFAFSHGLVEHALYDEVRPTRRAWIHRSVAEAIEKRAGDERGSQTALLAHHWFLASSPQDASKAARYAARAGDQALAQLAPDEALRRYQEALQLLDPLDEAIGKLLVALGEAQRQAGDEGYRATLLDAAHRAMADDRADLLVRAALANNRGIQSTYATPDHERIAVLRAALSAATSERDEALLLALLAAELQAKDRDEAAITARQAVEQARASHDDRTFSRVARLAEAAMRAPDSLLYRQALIAEALEACERSGDPALRVNLAIAAQGVALERGDREEFDRQLMILQVLVERRPEPYPRCAALLVRSLQCALDGDLTGAEAAADAAFELGVATGQPDAALFYGTQVMRIRGDQGRLAEIIHMLEQSVEDEPVLPVRRAGLVVSLCELGRDEDARQVAEPDFADGFASYPRDATWSTAMIWMAEACRRLSCTEPAAVLAEQLAPWRDQVAYTGVTCEGSLARGLGLVLAASGDRAAAIGAFEQAFDVHRRLGAPILVARTELDLAATIVADDPDRARELAARAVATADRLGLPTVRERAHQLLEG